MKCGLLGRKLGHSYSPQIHAFLGDYSYALLEKEPEELESFLNNGDFSGINVTMPYKKEVIPYLDGLSDVAAQLGTVNTIVRKPDGSLFGHNTDYFGFESMVKKSGLCIAGKKVLVLGSGGASSTAVAVLKAMGAEVVVISRNGENHYGNLSLHRDADALVNTTPVGMYPKTGISPVDLSIFPNLAGVLDVVYNPARTQLLLDAQARGIPCMNGLWMLVAQAKEAAQWFTNTTIGDDQITKIYDILSAQMQNIILIGMPGCGKSTIGRLLAQACGKRYADGDEKIVELAGRSIPDIFHTEGEAGFREWETRALEILGRESSCVIATGGGCVTQERNFPLLHQNGTCFWLRRDLDLLPTEGRPLSNANRMADMYAAREAGYQRFADYVIDNNADPMDTVQKIIAILEGD